MTAPSTEPVILLYAMRYAFGKKTVAVGRVADTLLAWRDEFSADERQQIVQDITVAIENGIAGAACDVARWREVMEAMR